MPTFTVTDLFDSGAGSPREAIALANANPDADMILFNSGLSGTLSLTGGELGIFENLTIDGPGASLLTIDAGGLSRIFNASFSNPGFFTLEGLTLAGGGRLRWGDLSFVGPPDDR